jgi:hypothetical protein
MALRDKTTTRVDYTLSTIGEIVVIDSFSSFTDFAKTNSFIGAELVCRETVMEFNNLHIFRSKTGFLVNGVGTCFSHFRTYKVDR